ncbi:unnamed protein product [Spirodela intermedia]|uniref:Uncharacterized protein n=1 Tax=Spirodela intermedia TaxID=51605 RepID=A0A7I8IF70_SPIIN|nr:unnamed protein product [Spirodela intermedia]CAA6655512.1 unnamed protein product [Spirodela intermedia]
MRRLQAKPRCPSATNGGGGYQVLSRRLTPLKAPLHPLPTGPGGSISSALSLSEAEVFGDGEWKPWTRHGRSGALCEGEPGFFLPGQTGSCWKFSGMTGIFLFMFGPSLFQTRRSIISVRQRRQELEDEVGDLMRKLGHEEEVHRVLERALQKTTRSVLEIPTFLPHTTKELLAELDIVEGEIVRLEHQVNNIHHGLTNTSTTGQIEYVNPRTTTAVPVRAVNHEETTTTTMKKKPDIETRPMFFVNQATGRDYIYAYRRKEKASSSAEPSEKESPRMLGLQDKATNKGGLTKEKPPGQLPWNNLQQEKSVRSTIAETSPSPRSSEKKSRSPPPNKLSERIIKCLICVFLRITRTSRATELERSSSMSRSTYSSLGSRSIHLESSLNPKSGQAMQRETASQDPYGIFQIEGSITRDIGPYKHMVRFTSGSMDSKGLSACSLLLRKLRVLMNDLREVDPTFLTRRQKLAFWLNVYNACIMNGFLELGLPSTLEKIPPLAAVINVGGNELKAVEVEQLILRLASETKKQKEDEAVGWTNGRENPEPNIAFALSCGARSSPAVRIYTAEGILSELEKAKLEYLQASVAVTEARKLRSFSADPAALVEWICSQLPTAGTLRRSITECLRSQNRRKISEIVEVMPFEYDFQYLFFI